MRGQTFENYSWDQDLKFIYATVPLIQNDNYSYCKFTLSTISIFTKNHDCILSGKLSKSISVEDSIFWIEDSVMKLEIKKLKTSEWWDSLFLDCPEKLDVSKITPIDSLFQDVELEHREIVTKMLLDNKNKSSGIKF